MTTDTQPDPLALSLTLAYGLGAHGGPVNEEERALFEEWMRGHCWKIGGKWNGKTYVDEAESDCYPRPQAMLTRQLWAAWRDRAALGATEHGRVTGLAREHIRRAARFEEERDRLARGEFICGRCGLRKDADSSGPAPF